MAAALTAALTEHERRVAEAVAARWAPPCDPAGVVDGVASIFGISPTEIFGRSRRAIIADARCVVVYLLRERGWHQTELAAYLLRDHSTIAHLEHRIASSHELRALARDLVHERVA